MEIGIIACYVDLKQDYSSKKHLEMIDILQHFTKRCGGWSYTETVLRYKQAIQCVESKSSNLL